MYESFQGACGKLMDKSLEARDIGVPVLAGADRYYIENKLMDPPLASPNSYPVKGSVILPSVPVKSASMSFSSDSRP